MIKISRNFCRYSSLLSYYDFYIKSQQEDSSPIVNQFYNHIRSIITDVFTVIQFINIVLEEINTKISIPEEINTEMNVFKCEEYSDIIQKYEILSNSTIEITKEIIETVNEHLQNSNSLGSLLSNVLNDKNITDIFDITISNCNKNIIKQIITNLNKETFTDVLNIENLNVKNNEFCKTILEELLKNKEEIKKSISEFSKNWEEGRICLIEKIIIGLAISEYKTYKTPIQVIINEYINLSKEYSCEKSGTFINGLLDPILKRISLKENNNL